MDPITLIAAMDAALTAAERIGKLVAEAKKEGLISSAEQQAQLDRINRLRAKLEQ